MLDSELAEHLIREELLTPQGLQQAQTHQGMVGGSLETVILALGLITETALLEAIGRFWDTPTASGADLATISPQVALMISPRMARRFELVPFRLDGKRLLVATRHPGDLLVEDELHMLTGCLVSTHVCLEARLYEALWKNYRIQPSQLVVSVVKRLRGELRRPASPQTVTPAAPPPPPDFRPEQVPKAERPRPMPSIRRSQPQLSVPSELEISDDDLSMFPSLREALEAEAAVAEEAAAAAPAATAAQEAEEPQASPAAEHAGTFEAELEDPAEPPPLIAADGSPDDRLAAASVVLLNAEMRDDIADALLSFCAPYLRRRMLLVVRRDTVVGWRGEGEGVGTTVVRAISIPLGEPSVFIGLTQGMSFWLGALPPMPRNSELVLALGGPPPKDCVILPVTLRDKAVCFLYGDNMDEGVGGVPMASLRRLAAKAGLAFQVYLLKGKIRML